MASFILKTKNGETREFWCPDTGGYVREIDETHPGTLGQQVSRSLNYMGDMLWADETTLRTTIQQARRRELAALRKW